jgi:hypothetical protein
MRFRANSSTAIVLRSSRKWARELLKNCLEAGASRVEFGVEWQAVAKAGVHRRTIIDDGAGMDKDELLKFFSTLGEGGKEIGGVHDNFGVGAKIAALPWNPDGFCGDGPVECRERQGGRTQVLPERSVDVGRVFAHYAVSIIVTHGAKRLD